MTTEELQHALNRVAGTTGLDAQGAANVWAGTTGLDLLGALNTVAGNARGAWVGLVAVLNQLAGTTGLDVNAAAAQLVAGGATQGLMPSESLSPSGTLQPT